MKVNLVTPVNTLGYGNVGLNVFKSLVETGNDVVLFPIGPVTAERRHESLITSNVAKNKNYHTNAPSVRIWHQFELDVFPGKGKRVGWPIFELDKFTDREIHHLSSLDHIIVCSDWAKSVIEANGIKTPVSVVPLGVDSSIFYLSDGERLGRPYWTKNSTVFLNIGKWEKRKGHEELIAAFVAAFKPGDDVELWMINDNPFIGDDGNLEWKRKYLDTPMSGHIKFFPRFDSHEQLRTVYNHVDCAVFPTHAEGWNLEALEALACGVHVISTNYSGHTQFLTKANSHLLSHTGMEPAHDGRWFFGQGNWGSFDIEELVTLMRDVHERRQADKLGINLEGLKTAQKFSWKNTASRLVEVLS